VTPTYLKGSKSYGDHFAWWCESYLTHSVDQFAGQPVVLEQWQKEFMLEALAVDDDDDFAWQSVCLLVSRKNGKTALLAAYALWHLLETEGSPEILLAAASDKQAGRLFDAVVAYVRNSPEIAERVIVRGYIGEIARTDGRGKILRMSSSPERLHGYGPSLVICDEVAQWVTPNLRKAWAALTTGGGARRSAQTFTITTAGESHTRESGILGRLIDGNERQGELEKDGALTISRNFPGRTLVYRYEAQTTDPFDTEKIKAANPASWISEEFLARQAANPELSPDEFLQLHACVWTDGSRRAWIQRGAWQSLEVPDLTIPDGAELFVGVDAALADDCTAVAWAWRIPDSDRIGVKCHVIGARRGVPCHELVAERTMDPRIAIEVVQELAKKHTIREVSYDPNRFELAARMLGEEGFTMTDAWGRRANQTRAWASWFDGVQTGRIAHDGDLVLTEHVTHAEAEHTENGWKVRKLRGQGSVKIDALVAATIATWRCQVEGDSADYVLSWDDVEVPA
jgi:phage terminase large subunit-like protein